MIVTHKVNIDLGYGSAAPSRIDITQNDRYSRNLALSLHMNGRRWEPGNGVSALVNYVKPDGTGGSYNFLPDETPAWKLAGHIMTVALAPQVCTVPGRVKLAVSLIRDASQISTVTLELNVRKSPGLQATSADYYKLSGTVPNAGWTPNMLLGTDAAGDVVAVPIDSTLSEAGQAADAKTVGDRLAAAVTSVNGSLPDETGNVEIDTGAGAIQTINGLPPDKNGNITLYINALPAAAQEGQFFRVKEGANNQVAAVEAVYLDASEIVGYMYNGWRLPPLPQWDTETYPYALISIPKSTGQLLASLYLLSELNVNANSDTGSDMIICDADTTLRSEVSLDSRVAAEAEWPELAAPAAGNIALSSVIWTNTDLSKTDGTLYLAASDPAPVYGCGGSAAGNSAGSGTGLAVVDLATPICNRYTTDAFTQLSESDSAALSAAVASNTPCALRFDMVTEEDDGTAVTRKITAFPMTVSLGGSAEMMMLPALDGVYRFENTEDGWIVAGEFTE